MIKAVVDRYEADPQYYNANQTGLFMALQGTGLADYRIRNIVDEFFRRAPSGLQPSPGATPPAMGPNWIDNMMQMDQQLDYYERMQEIRARYRGNGGGGQSGGSRPKREEVQDRLAEMQLDALNQAAIDKATGKTTMKDSGGMTMVEERTEYEVVTDAEGNEVKDKSGAVKTRPITVTRTTPLGVPNSAATLDPEEAREEKWMNKMYRMNMMRMMSSGMNPMGVDGYGGMGVQPQMERYALLKPDGTPYLDGAGNPIMQVRSLQSSMQQPQMTMKDGVDMTLKIVEAVKPGTNSEETTYYREKADKMGDKFNDLLLEQIAQYQTQDPVTQTLDAVTKLKTSGILGPQTDNVKIAEMSNDLEKFKTEQATKMEQWKTEREDIREGRIASREQMKEVTETLRDAIKQVAAPIAENFGQGLRAGMSQPRPAQPAPLEDGPPQTEPSQWSNEELVKQYNKANQVGRVVTDAQVKMREELQKRGIGPGQPEAVAPTATQVGD